MVVLSSTRSVRACLSGSSSTRYRLAKRSATRSAHAARLLPELGFSTDEFQPQGLDRAPNVWAFLFSQWPSMATRKFVEGRGAEAHWTLTESLGAKDVTAEEAIVNLASRDRLRASLLAPDGGRTGAAHAGSRDSRVPSPRAPVGTREAKRSASSRR